MKGGTDGDRRRSDEAWSSEETLPYRLKPEEPHGVDMKIVHDDEDDSGERRKNGEGIQREAAAGGEGRGRGPGG